MIVGQRIRCRAIEEGDLVLLAQWLNDPEISQLVGGWSYPISMTEQRTWFAKSHADRSTQRWMVETHEHEVIGLTGLWQIDFRNRHALTALKIGPKTSRGQGLGTDAILTVMTYAFFQLGLNRLWTEILVYNVPSYRAYVEKCGFRVEGMHRQHVLRDGVFHDQLLIGIMKDEFIALPVAQPYLPIADRARAIVLDEHLASGPKK